MKRLLLVLLAATCDAIAIPIVSNITINQVTHTSANFQFDSDTADQTGWVKLGLSSGVYTLGTDSMTCYAAVQSPRIQCSLSISGLAPSTQYFWRPTLRPNVTDGTGMCAVDGCGAVEASFTTDPQPAVHPAAPVPPSVQTLNEPDVSAYFHVVMSCQGGIWKASTNYSAQANWAGGISTGDSAQTVFNQIWYGTTIDFPESTSCGWVQTESSFHTGVSCPTYSTPNNGAWVVIRTVPSSAANFPPFGARTGPQYASKLATLIVQTPAMPKSPGNGDINLNGQIFDCYRSPANHFWFENLAITHAFNSTVYPPGETDPAAFGLYFRAVGAEPYAEVVATTPDHMVLDRIYAYGQPWPSREIGCVSPGGTVWAIIGTYCDAEFWVEGVYPIVNPISSGATMTIPQVFYQFSALDNTPIGMTTPAGYLATSTSPLTNGAGSQPLTTQAGLSWVAGNPAEMICTTTLPAYNPYSVVGIGTVSSYIGTALTLNITTTSNPDVLCSSWRIVQPVVVTFSGESLGSYTGTVVAWIDSTGVTVDYATASGVTATCTSGGPCHIVTEVAPARYPSVPSTSQYYFVGSFSGGTFVMTGSVADSTNPSIFPVDKPIGTFINPGSSGIYRNNYQQALGQSIYSDTIGIENDISLDHNYLYFPRSKMRNSASWNGYGYTNRNAIEPKQGLRWAITGNIIDGTAAYQNAGNGIYIAGSWNGTFSNGTQDFTITNNILRHVSTGIQLAGGGAQAPPDSPTGYRFDISNNLVVDLNRWSYSGGPVGYTGFAAGPISAYPMMTDLNIHNNTFGPGYGGGPAIFEFGGASCGSTVMGEGLRFSNNLIFANKGPSLDYWLAVDIGVQASGGANCGGPQYTLFPANPRLPDSNGTWTQQFDSAWVQKASSSVPSWVTGPNTVAFWETCSAQNTCASTGTSAINTAVAAWPDAISGFPLQSTTALRSSAIGLPSLSVSSGVPTDYAAPPSPYNPGTNGVNMQTLLSATGIVQQIAVYPSATVLTFKYLAPDASACSVDVSPDAGVTWTRFTDAGGSRGRSLNATSLTAATAYQYRIQCYFDQSATYEFLPSQITSATVTTSVVAGRTPKIGFTLPAGASKASVTMTPFSGSPVVTACASSPCTLTVAAGSYTQSIQPQTAGSVSVGPASSAVVTIN